MLRVIVLVSASLGIAAALTVLTARQADREARRLGTTQPWASSPEATAIIKQGTDLVHAIYRYKREVGLWPDSLQALVPEFARAEQIAGWKYSWQYWGEWSVASYRAYPHGKVGYRYTGGHGQWVISSGSVPRQWVDPGRAPVGAEQTFARTVATLRQRIASDSQTDAHWFALVSTCVRAKRFAEARQFCDELAANKPEHWYPPAMQAYLDAQAGRVDAGERRLTELATTQPSLTNRYLLFRYYQATDQAEKALAEVGQATKTKLLDPPGLHAELLLHRMAKFAYENRDYALVLSIADAVDRVMVARGYGESGSAYRAPALLAMGEFDGAAANCRQTMEEYKRQAFWPKDLRKLMQAIERKDKDFVYHGWGGHLEPLPLLVEFE